MRRSTARRSTASSQLVTLGHGDVAGSAASEKLNEHLIQGKPLSMREAQQIRSECTIRATNRATNRAALEKLALRHVVPQFHEEARELFNREVVKLGMPDDVVLKPADLEKRLKPLLRDLEDLQADRRPLPTLDDVTTWAGLPEDDKTFFGGISVGSVHGVQGHPGEAP